MPLPMISDTPDTGKQRRAARLAARRTLWRESKMRRLRGCGRTLRDADAGVRVRVATTDEGRVGGFAGLAACGSVHACPVCSARIAVERASEISAATARHLATGGGVLHLTLTMRHHDGQGLGMLWDGLSKAWDRMRRAAAWADLSDDYGLALDYDVRRPPAPPSVDARGRTRVPSVHWARPSLGYVRVVEVTHGENGWHVHVHALLFLSRPAGRARVEWMGRRLFDSWRTALVGLGFDAPSDEHGYRVRVVADPDDAAQMGDYFTKAVYEDAELVPESATRIGLEVAAGTLTKSARHGNRTPFVILADVVALGDADDLDLWHEWEKGSKGRRQMLWSRRLREHLLGTPERTDEEVAADDALAPDAVDVGVLTKSAWRHVTRLGLEVPILEVVERTAWVHDAFLEVGVLLVEHGIGLSQWRRPDPPDDGTGAG